MGHSTTMIRHAAHHHTGRTVRYRHWPPNMSLVLEACCGGGFLVRVQLCTKRFWWCWVVRNVQYVMFMLMSKYQIETETMGEGVSIVDLITQSLSAFVTCYPSWYPSCKLGSDCAEIAMPFAGGLE
jgi:hypothetical protein